MNCQILNKTVFFILVFCHSFAFVGISQAQDIPPTVQPGAVEQEFSAPQPSLNRDEITLPSPSVSSLLEGVADVRFILRELIVEGNNSINIAELSPINTNKTRNYLKLTKL